MGWPPPLIMPRVEGMAERAEEEEERWGQS